MTVDSEQDLRLQAEMREEHERRIRQLDEDERKRKEEAPQRLRMMRMFGGHSREEDEEARYWKAEEKRAKRATELTMRFRGMVLNNNHGYGYKVCDMERLKRFLTIGSETNNYYCSPKEILIESVECVKKLINDGHYQEVMDTVEQYAKEGRAAKDEPLLVVFALCAVNARKEVRRAAYAKVNSICSIPTQLFRFLELTHGDIVRRRIADPPSPQLYRRVKNPKENNPEVGASEQREEPNENVDKEREEPCENVDKEREEPCENVDEEREEPCENVDETQAPRKKVRKEREFKLVNKKETKSLGWGRMRREAIAKFYTDDQKSACRLLSLLTKYKHRHNWSQKEVIQYTHPKMSGDDMDAKNLVIRYCTRGYEKIADRMNKLMSTPGLSEEMSEVIAYIDAINSVRNLKSDVDGDEEKLIEILKTYGKRPQAKEFSAQHTFEGSATKENESGRKSPIHIVREHIPTGFLNSVKVWEQMLVDMPMTAMIRNLAKMSSLEMFGPDSKNTKYVLDALANQKRLQSARIHPMKILIAQQTYRQGRGFEGSLSWTKNEEIMKALDDAFHKSFKSPEFGKTFKTGKKFLLALDVSPSMARRCVGASVISADTATAAMALMTWNVEDDKDVEIMSFSATFLNLKGKLKRSMTVAEAEAVTSRIGYSQYGGTDCSLPMIYALDNKMKIDVFVVYTDNETEYTGITPMDALRMYNIEMKRDAKLIVVALTSAGFTIADPNYGNALDICGFDANVPEIIYNFVTGDKSMKCNVCNDCKSRSDGN